ncbi:MAG: hypothetical protein ACOYVK_02745 [Bacillota bacterium]
MTNINCSLDCFFENDGKCTLTHVSIVSSTPHPQCVYYQAKIRENLKAEEKLSE